MQSCAFSENWCKVVGILDIVLPLGGDKRASNEPHTGRLSPITLQSHPAVLWFVSPDNVTYEQVCEIEGAGSQRRFSSAVTTSRQA